MKLTELLTIVVFVLGTFLTIFRDVFERERNINTGDIFSIGILLFVYFSICFRKINIEPNIIPVLINGIKFNIRYVNRFYIYYIYTWIIYTSNRF